MEPKTAVIALDLQRDFLEEGGRMRVARGQVEPLIAAANAVIDRAAARDVPVAYVLNEFPPSQWVLNFLRRGAALAGSRGAELDPRVHVAGDARFPKCRGDAFTNPALDAFLREHDAKHVVVLGVFAPHCVRATVGGALRHGYRVTLVRDGVAAASDRARDRAIAHIERDGAAIATSASLG